MNEKPMTSPIAYMTGSQIKQILKDHLNDALECINAEGSIKDVEIDLMKMEVKFTFDIHEVPEDDYIGICGY